MISPYVFPLLKTSQSDFEDDELIDYVCEKLNVPNEKFFSLTRKSEVVKARQFSAFILRHFKEVSLPKIGIILGNNHGKIFHQYDHCTIIMGLRKVKNEAQVDELYYRELHDLCKGLSFSYAIRLEQIIQPLFNINLVEVMPHQPKKVEQKIILPRFERVK